MFNALKVTLFGVLIAGLVSACTPTQAIKGVSDMFPARTLADARVARALAVQSGDKDGELCYDAIIEVQEEKLVDPEYTIDMADAGVLTAVQLLRNKRLSREEGIDPRVRRACAVLVLDAQKEGVRRALKYVPGISR